MNPQLDKLQPYPFERLTALLAGLQPPADQPLISLAVGEPKHAIPEVILAALQDNLSGISHYPSTRGEETLREAIAHWLIHRFKLCQIDPRSQILPVNGTREALFAFAQTTINSDTQAKPLVGMPNPGYQIYEGAALLANAEPLYLPCLEENHFLPDLNQITAEQWQRLQLLYLCTPGNPTGAVMPLDYLQQVIQLAEEHDFIIASDECYSEIYPDESHPPPGLLEAATKMGHDNFSRCMVFHSLSKRSNVPGMRSGFVAGDARLIDRFFKYRTYHGCAMSPAVQAASIVAWSDEYHVRANRDLYRDKFTAMLTILNPILGVSASDASFYLWPKAPGGNDEEFVKTLWSKAHIRCLPGRYLGREMITGQPSSNPGAGRVRLSLVAPGKDCEEAAQKIVNLLKA